MLIELRKLSEIKPYPGNPRQNDAAVEAVAKSIREFGFRQPIVVDADGVIICGHTRWKAAHKLGLEDVPVHVARDLSPEQVKALRIADNQTATLAEWDLELLPIKLTELQAAEFDLGLLGFDADELAKLLDPGIKDGLTDPDDIPEPHQLFADHLTAEYRARTEGRGRTVAEWKRRPERADNHWLDGLVGCAVAASMQGCDLINPGNGVRKPKERKPLSQMGKA